MPIEPGKLRHRIAIESPTRSKNEFGEEVEGWSVLAEVRASVEPLSGRELWQAQQVAAQVSHRVQIRYRPGVEPEQRVCHRGRHLEISVVRNIEERNEWLELLCIEKV